MPLATPTADDCVRLLNTQPLLDTLADTDTKATAKRLRTDVTCDLMARLEASLALAKAGQSALPTTIRADVSARLDGAPQPVVEAAQDAAFAAAFADLLHPDTAAALALPWALAATTKEN